MSELATAGTVPEIREELAESPNGQQSGEENVNNVAASPDSVPNLRVDQLRVDDDGNSSMYTSEEEGGSHDERGKSPEPEFVAPNDELKDKIIHQVEFYFSDANLLKDAFLLKHVRRNKQGYVSIKLITSFKKVKSLTKDFRVVAYSLRQSTKLEVNDEGKKVRRKDPLPEWDETTPSRSVVAVNLPMENPSIETIAELFSKCGEVSLIRILRPGKTVPQDVKKHAAKHPEIGTTTCAVVEFEKHDSAQAACEQMTDTDNWRKGMRVVILAAPKKKDKKKDKDGDDSGRDDDDEDPNKKKKRRERRKKNRLNELADNDSSCCYSSGSEAESGHRKNHTYNHGHPPLRKTLSPNYHDTNRLSPSQSPRSSPRSSPITSPRQQRRKNLHGKSPLADDKHSPSTSPKRSPQGSPDMGRKRYDNYSSGDSTPSSPWVQRRLKLAAQDKSPLAKEGSPASEGRHRMLNMEGVIRQPRGPDDTIGFHLGRGKPRSSTFS